MGQTHGAFTSSSFTSAFLCQWKLARACVGGLGILWGLLLRDRHALHPLSFRNDPRQSTGNDAKSRVGNQVEINQIREKKVEE